MTLPGLASLARIAARARLQVMRLEQFKELREKITLRVFL
jgi:hypothetical protein